MADWNKLRQRAEAALRATGYSGQGPLTFRQSAALHEAVGLPGVSFAQENRGESALNPRAIGHDPGGTTGLGLDQITTKYNDDVIRRFGGRQAMLNPVNSALGARLIYDRQGPGAWYGTKYVTGWNQHYKGNLGRLGGLGGPASAGGDPAIGGPIGGAPSGGGVNPISVIASLSQQDTSNPYNAIMQRGWNMLSQLWEQKNGGGGSSTLGNVMGGGGGVAQSPFTPSAPAGGGHGKVIVAPGANAAGSHISPNVLGFVKQIAGRFGQPLTIGTGTNHSRLTINGTVSDHTPVKGVGYAADIPLTGNPLIKAGQDALIAAGMSPAKARKITGGGFNVGGWQIIFNTNAPGWGDHTTHLHVGMRH
jgi:hypothetical protein